MLSVDRKYTIAKELSLGWTVKRVSTYFHLSWNSCPLPNSENCVARITLIFSGSLVTIIDLARDSAPIISVGVHEGHASNVGPILANVWLSLSYLPCRNPPLSSSSKCLRDGYHHVHQEYIDTKRQIVCYHGRPFTKLGNASTEEESRRSIPYHTKEQGYTENFEDTKVTRFRQHCRRRE